MSNEISSNNNHMTCDSVPKNFQWGGDNRFYKKLFANN